jgi:hypothetical protein
MSTRAQAKLAMAAVKRRDGRGRCLVWDGTETLRLEGDRRQPTAGDQPYHARGQRRVAACGNPDDGERQGQVELDMRGDIGQGDKVTRWETGWLPAPAPAPLRAAASGGFSWGGYGEPVSEWTWGIEGGDV